VLQFFFGLKLKIAIKIISKKYGGLSEKKIFIHKSIELLLVSKGNSSFVATCK